MKTIYKYTCLVIILLYCMLPLPGCRKFIEVDPPVTSVNEGNVYADNSTAAAALTGIYSKMANSSFSLDLTVLPELAADNLALFNLDKINYTAYYQNILQPSDPSTVPRPWLSIYPFAFNANAAIKGLTESNILTKVVKQNLLGEAYFLRAFYYFYLVNLYGDVPLALSTDYTVNNKLSRIPTSQVYAQIIADAKQAQTLLSDNYLKSDAFTAYATGEEERIRPNRSTAIALLARVYLYQKDWANAEQMATEVINKATLYSTTALNQVFLKNSKETIWALQPVKDNLNTDEGNLFTLRTGEPEINTGRIIYLSEDFMDSFQSGDQRKNTWTGVQSSGTKPYPYAAKYKAIEGSDLGQEYTIVFRLAEQYLIRAEAKIEQNRVTEGIADLNVLRDRAIDKNADIDEQLKLLPTTLSKAEALTSLSYERRFELFCEWGHRWFDLKRTGQLDAVMTVATTLKGGGVWKPYRALLPVPAEEIRLNSSLSQNAGYTN
ncbi:Starch-binding associating with outer membrane [Chitinophaga sp. CF118]|uniref:RagB/SusD family nutrient uptake outer membrane protein n=1 Tax=Chitinophaga sp. CF118 TaxID=1884367 RepID=UPI0008E88D52|nr:RagB/SusD family nutrient uptake outer membrane protein [Chitinophaga sp. CF118]SFF07028.1 Starch-binding associating with outer membrane [Chitinophaga sp. CF118]